jgi:hypothetical protein
MTAQNERQAPRSVRYARGLLGLQAGCWVVASALCMLGVVENAAVGSALGAAGFALAGVIAAMFAVLKGRLARRLLAGTVQGRRVAIGVELSMTCFGVLGTLSLDLSGGIAVGLIGLPLVVGTGLSLAAALGLLRPPARRYFASPTSNRASLDEPSNADGPHPAAFWRPHAIASTPHAIIR